VARALDEDDLIEHWTLMGDELKLLGGRTGLSKLGLALWLKFFIAEGRFQPGRAVSLPASVWCEEALSIVIWRRSRSPALRTSARSCGLGAVAPDWPWGCRLGPVGDPSKQTEHALDGLVAAE
jgi:hypothetical protein